MRILVVNAPADLARDLQRRTEASRESSLVVADPHNPLTPSSGQATYLSFSSRRKVDLKAIGQLRNAIRKLQPDIVHSFLPRSLAQTVLASIGLRRPPKIVSFYGITRVPSWREPADWVTYLSPKVTMHACESNAVKASLVQGGVPEARCEVIYNCVSQAASPLSRLELRRRFNMPDDAFVIGCVATIRPVKGIDILLEAFARCLHLPNVHCLIAGPVHDERVSKLAESSQYGSRLHLLGYTPGASSFMRGMDLFVMPSRQEGLCRALLEAMGQEVCPVVSDAGGMKEVVRHEMDGLVFPREDSAALAEAIELLYRDHELNRAYAHSAKARVAEVCAPEVVGAKVWGMYERLANAA